MSALTDDQLQDAYRAVAHRTWPDLHELKINAARLKLVEGYAQRRASGGFAAAEHLSERRPNVNAPAPATRPPVPPGPPRAAASKLHVPHHPPLEHDRKRLAAGDRDE